MPDRIRPAPDHPGPFRIVVVGGGLAGAAFTLHFMRDNPGLDADLTIVEARERLGAGLAYSAAAPEHRVNVAASRMSLIPEEPLHFDAWLRHEAEPERDPGCVVDDVGLFPSRSVYGRYVDSTLRSELAQDHGTRSAATFRHLRARADAVMPAEGCWVVRCDNGEVLEADAVILAIGHTAPDLPAMLRDATGLVPDPWDTAAIRAIPKAAQVVIIGTGLTACDMIASLKVDGHKGPITALSRHGLLPRPRTSLPVAAEGDFTTAPERTARLLLRRARAAIRVAQAAGRPWENVIDALRQQSAAAWGTLNWTERKRLLRHLRTYWDVHRFQCAPQIDATVREMQESGQLTVRAASVLQAESGHVRVLARTHGREKPEPDVLAADIVINCTGPGHRSVTQLHPVLRALADAGLLQADPARLGILVDLQSRVIRADGSAWPTLFVAGPLARGTHGELMGLPQVNLQPRAVAASVAELASACSAAERDAQLLA